MKRVFEIILVLIVFLFSCSKKSNNTIDKLKNTDSKSKRQTLSILMYSDFSKKAQVDNWKAFVSRYKKHFPNVNLDAEILFNEDYHKRLSQRADNNNLPDLMTLWPGGNRVERYVKNGLIENLSPFIDEDDSMKNKINPVALTPQGPNGEIYELPETMTITTVAYLDTSKSKGYEFDTLDDLKNFTKNTGIPAITIAAKAPWVMGSTLFSTILGRIAGANWIKETVEDKSHKFTDKEFIEALNVLKDLYDLNIISKSNLKLTYENRIKAFNEGNSPIMIDGQWAISDINKVFKNDIEKIKIIPFPSINGEKNNSASTTIGTGFGMKVGLSKETKKLAWEFIKYYIGESESIKRLNIEGEIPVYEVDFSSVEISYMTKQIVAYSSSNHALDVIDAYLTGKANDVLNIGLKDIASGKKTPTQVAKEVQNAFDNM